MPGIRFRLLTLLGAATLLILLAPSTARITSVQAHTFAHSTAQVTVIAPTGNSVGLPSPIDPARGTVGSAAWARYLVDFGIAHELDAREMPKGWKTGYYDPQKMIFIATDGGVVITVITDATSYYVAGLKKKKP